MTRQELRVYLADWFCGCGHPEHACAALLRLLRLQPLYNNRAEIDAWLPDDGVQHLLLYKLSADDLTEHGGSVGGGWLTDKGRDVQAALAVEEADGFEALTESACVHGFAEVDGQPYWDHDCMRADAAA